MEKLRRGNGITLIALVVTMIILIILATVTISATFGDNGLIKQAEKTKDMATNSIAKENEDLNRLEQEYANMMADDGDVPEPPTDTTGPTVNIVVGTKTENSIAITVNATDNESGLAENGTYKYYLDGAEKATSESNTYTFEGLTAETQYTIKVEAFDKVGNKGENSIMASTEKKPGVDAGEIEKNPTAYYGSEVRGYTCTSQGVSKWRIFYADSTNIYLIADDYISYQYAPNGQKGSSVGRGSDYELNIYSGVANDYSGAEWIGSYSKGNKWLDKYLRANGTSTNTNIREVAYLMDTSVWNIYAGENSEYAMGGPTLELFCESYKDTHPSKYIECRVNSIGYEMKWNSETSYQDSIYGITDNSNNIYIKTKDSKAFGMWLASPASDNNSYVLRACDWISNTTYDNSKPGLRPIVCLKSGVQLNKVSDGVYEIVK